jgi:hypothetical protein
MGDCIVLSLGRVYGEIVAIVGRAGVRGWGFFDLLGRPAGDKTEAGPSHAQDDNVEGVAAMTMSKGGG